VEKRLAGIEKDLPRGGRKPSKREKVTTLIIETTTQTKPANATHWSVRTLGEKLGIDKSMVYRVWQDSGLKPHLSKTFKVSNDKKFIEKVIDVVPVSQPLSMRWCCVRMKTSVETLGTNRCRSRKGVWER
jgi:hypothetical protein